MNIEQLTIHTHSKTATVSVYQRLEALMVQAARDGQLTYEEEETIIANMVYAGKPTADICGLFRRLQEQVWDGALILDSPRR